MDSIRKTERSTGIAALFLLLSCLTLFPQLASAANSEPTLAASPYVFKQLNQAQKQLDEGKPKEALATLHEIIKLRSITPYEKAVAQQASAVIYYQQENLKEAIEQFKLANDSGALPTSSRQQTRFNLAQLYLAEKHYDRATVILKQWFKLSKNPPGEAYLLLASIHAANNKYPPAIASAEDGVKLLKKPLESHYRFLLGLYFETKAYKKAEQLLESLTLKFPDNKEYWLQLASLYSQQNRDQESLAVSEIAYQRKLLTENDEIVRLARQLLVLEYPHKAAKVLDAAIKAKTAEANFENNKLLASAWFNAREYKKALGPLAHAAKQAIDGSLYFRLAQVHFELENYQDTIKYLQLSSATGPLKKPGPHHLLNGLAHYELNRFEKASTAFRKASKFKKTEQQAAHWLAYIEQNLATSQ